MIVNSEMINDFSYQKNQFLNFFFDFSYTAVYDVKV